MLAEKNTSYLNASELGSLLGISRQAAWQALKTCFKGGSWKGKKLEVILNKGQGGKNGISYLVDASSIPPEFFVNPELTSPVNAVPALQPVADLDSLTFDWEPSEPQPTEPKGLHFNDEKTEWKLGLVNAVIRDSKPKTKERCELVKKIAADARYPAGKKRGKAVSVATLYNWIQKYEANGLAGLGRNARADIRKIRVCISQKFDSLISELSEQEQQKLSDSIRKHVASQWRNGAPSWPTVQLNSVPFVMKKARTLGCQLDDKALRSLCLLPRPFIETEKHYRAVAIRRKDAGLSATIQTPRIKRSRAHLRPMEWVAGDVHHVDIAIQRDDGSLCTAKAVAWLDLATNRAFISLFLMPKGKMICREHVIQSFVDMCSDPNWGVPTRLYLDRGGEYQWDEFIGDLFRLKQRVDARDMSSLADDVGVQRSRAYNPQSKIIETLFGALERSALRQLPGHIGGNRMKSKVENQGKKPTPYPGDFEAFENAFQTALDYYHVKPQQTGHLAGQSPNEKFKTFIAAGWKSLLLDKSELAVVFCTQETRVVRAGGVFRWRNVQFRHDALLALAGIGKVLVREPLFGDKSRLYVYDEYEKFLCVATPETVYRMGDVRGAGEQQRQTAEFNRQIRQMEKETDKLDMEVVMREATEAYGPAPQAESRGVVSISSEHRKAAEMAQAEQDAPGLDEARYEQEQLAQYALLERLANASARKD
jgi:hypothetical protein